MPITYLGYRHAETFMARDPAETERSVGVPVPKKGRWTLRRGTFSSLGHVPALVPSPGGVLGLPPGAADVRMTDPPDSPAAR